MDDDEAAVAVAAAIEGGRGGWVGGETRWSITASRSRHLNLARRPLPSCSLEPGGGTLFLIRRTSGPDQAKVDQGLARHNVPSFPLDSHVLETRPTT